MRSIVDRDLNDAALADLSADRRFAIAYNAVLQLATMAISCSGYRITGSGHHQTTFTALPLAIGAEVSDLAAYFDICRRKRNIVDYDFASAASESEAAELVERAATFRKQVEEWIAEHHPSFAR